MPSLPSTSPIRFSRPPGSEDDLFGDEDWGFTPRSLMEDGERFKDCAKLLCVCSVCLKETPFAGLVSETSGESGLNCPSCGAMYFGRG